MASSGETLDPSLSQLLVEEEDVQLSPLPNSTTWSNLLKIPRDDTAPMAKKEAQARDVLKIPRGDTITPGNL